MTLLEIEQDVYRRLQKNVASPDATVKARIDTYINDTYRQLMREYGVELREESLTLTTESGRARYALPSPVTQIINVTDTTNRIKLQERSLSWIREQDPSVPAQVTGTPWVYAVLNEAGIGFQPTVHGINDFQIVSNTPADVMGAAIEYSTIDGMGFHVLSTTLTGLVPVPLVFVSGVSEFFRVQLTAAPVGKVSLQQIGPPVVTLAEINGAFSTALHKWVIHLWPTPNGAITYTIDFDRPRRPLVNPGDEPALPEEFHTVLVYGACVAECLTMDDNRLSYYTNKYESEVGQLRAFLHRARGQNWIPKGRARGWSDLGPYFPGDSSGGYW